MDPISVGLGVGGLASNIFTNMSNQSNNDRNFEFVKRQQDFAERSFRQQMRFNSPVTQANLMRAAGINPALHSSGLAGSVSAGSSGGSPSNIPMESLDMSGLNGLASNIGLLESQRGANSAKAFSDKASGFNTLLRNYTQYERDTADIYRLRKEGDLSAEQARSEIAKRQPMIDMMNSEIRSNNMQANLFEQKVETEIEQTAQAAAQRKIMEFRLSKEPDRFAAELQTMVSETAYNYASAYLQKVNAKSIEQLTPWQKQSLAAGIQKAISETTLNTKNRQYLEKKLGSFDTDKWFERGSTIVSGLTQGVMMGLGIGYFSKAAGAAKVVKGFAN